MVLPIWFAGVPDGGSLNPTFILLFAGFMFVLIFAIFTLFDLCRGETSLAEIKEFSTPSHMKRYAAVGVCDALNGIFVVFAAARTAPFLQAILGTLSIFWTILFRFIILHKSPSKAQVSYALYRFCMHALFVICFSIFV